MGDYDTADIAVHSMRFSTITEVRRVQRLNAATATFTDTAPELKSLANSADHVDVKSAESAATLRECVAAAMAWRPAWMRALFRARSVLARVMRLNEPTVPAGKPLAADELSFAPGANISFFTVVSADEDRYLLLEASDSHLAGYLAVVMHPGEAACARFDAVTLVKYRRWTGPLYFNIIRPFHHLVVAAMVKAAARSVRCQGGRA